MIPESDEQTVPELSESNNEVEPISVEEVKKESQILQQILTEKVLF